MPTRSVLSCLNRYIIVITNGWWCYNAFVQNYRTLTHMVQSSLRMSWQWISVERKRKTDTCLSSHMSTSKTSQCLSNNEQHLLIFYLNSLFSFWEKNNEVWWNKYGSPAKSTRLRKRMGKYFHYFQHPGKRPYLCKVLRAIALQGTHTAEPIAYLLVRKIFS